jgi:two-component system, NtrC family, response regulator AtoC
MPSKKATILVVDDEELVRWSLRQRFEADGYEVFEAEDGAAALEQFDRNIGLALLDYRLPDTDGLSLLRRIKAVDPEALVIMMTAYSSVEDAVTAMREGAYHYARKPFNLDEISLTVERALETARLRQEVETLRQVHGPGDEGLIGESPAMRKVKGLLDKIATSPASTVLVTGDSGTGKDLAAKLLHGKSGRNNGPFLNITCSALPSNLLESELFGHERGAFTDAHARKRGLLEHAHRGTVFLDEISELDLSLQAKLLRFLEDKCFRRVGGATEIRSNVRIIAATNVDLREAVRKGTFREDLYYRLAVLTVFMPPLRDRGGDVITIASYFINRFNEEFRKNIRKLSSAAKRHLLDYTWPGNVRELRNAIERAVLLTDGDELDLDAFGLLAVTAIPSDSCYHLPVGGVNLQELERSLLEQALERSGGNQTKAGDLLGLNRDQIRYRISKFDMSAKNSE